MQILYKSLQISVGTHLSVKKHVTVKTSKVRYRIYYTSIRFIIFSSDIIPFRSHARSVEY